MKSIVQMAMQLGASCGAPQVAENAYACGADNVCKLSDQPEIAADIINARKPTRQQRLPPSEASTCSCNTPTFPVPNWPMGNSSLTFAHLR
jgi:hypothetical protein